MARAAAPLTGAWKLSQTILRPQGQSSFSTAVQRKAPKAVVVSQKFLARRMRQQYRINQTSVQPINQQLVRKLAEAIGQDYRSGRSRFWYWLGVFEGFFYALLFTHIWNSLKAKTTPETNSPQDESPEEDIAEELE
ncbi:hypothetical protein IQ06DRAFT_343609 [Phaeosphaeriaceae sp. SRC1lsM3a]|nr:hypothetical protein IQ06DRAFT_343609 [Stagonospora sp. SRC1lsM3a]